MVTTHNAAPEKKMKRSDLFEARNVETLFTMLTTYLDRTPTGAELRKWVNTVLGPWAIPAEVRAQCSGRR